jgi:hypothetical protein
MIVNADRKQVGVETSSSRGSKGMVCLEGDGAMGRPGQEGMAEDVKPLYDGAKAPFNATTNLVGFPQERKKVSPPFRLGSLFLLVDLL